MTKDRVSAICRALDEQVELFRSRPLEGAYPYLWLDAKQVKVRDHGRVVSKALVIAYAVHETGVREVIGLDVGEVESGAFWTEFLRSLRQRGLLGVRLAVSDDHEGLKAAIARLEPVAPKVCRLLEEAEEDLIAFYLFPPSTGPSCGPSIRWSGSTRRSAGAPTSSGSSPTTPP